MIRLIAPRSSLTPFTLAALALAAVAVIGASGSLKLRTTADVDGRLPYSQAPNDSGVTNFVGTVSTTTGVVTPIAVGFTKATGMVFVPNSSSEGGD